MDLLTMLNEDLNNEGGSNERPGFTKFAVGNTNITVLAFAAPRWTHYINASKLTVNCPGAGCPVCAIIKASKKNDVDTDHKSTKKYGMLIYNHNSGELEILDQKTTFVTNFRDMLVELKESLIEKAMEENEELTIEEAELALDKSLLDPTNFVTRVKRVGTGFNDTKYTFKKATKADQKEVPEAIIEKVSTMELDELWLKLDNDQLRKLISGKTLKEIFNPEEEIEVNFDK